MISLFSSLTSLPTPNSLLPTAPEPHQTSFSNFLFLKYTQIFAVSGPLHTLFPPPRTLFSPNLHKAISSTIVLSPLKCHHIKEVTTPATWLKLILPSPPVLFSYKSLSLSKIILFIHLFNSLYSEFLTRRSMRTNSIFSLVHGCVLRADIREILDIHIIININE